MAVWWGHAGGVRGHSHPDDGVGVIMSINMGECINLHSHFVANAVSMR